MDGMQVKTDPKRDTTDRTANLTLFCFPWAGGSPATLRSMTARVDSEFEIRNVSMPGRDQRLDPVETVADLCARLLEQLGSSLRSGKFAFFGHSLGAMVAFELSHLLLTAGLPVPVHLTLSSARPPGRRSLSAPLHELTDQELIDAISALRVGTKSQDDALLRFTLPTLRRELTLAETWNLASHEALDVPVLIAGGRNDQLVPPEELDHWRGWFGGDIELQTYPGGHFYLMDHPVPLLLRDLGDSARRAAAARGPRG